MDESTKAASSRRGKRALGAIAAVFGCVVICLGAFGHYHAHLFFGDSRQASRLLNSMFRPAEFIATELEPCFNYRDWCCSFCPHYEKGVVDSVRKTYFP